MTVVTFKTGLHLYNSTNKTFTMSEKDVPRFDTEYKILNIITDKGMDFKFDHTTGPEFEPDTKWVYLNSEGYKLEVANDPKMVEEAKKKLSKSKTSWKLKLK